MRQNLRILLVLVICGFFASTLHAQARLTHSVTRAKHDPPTLGHDYWFALPTNYGNDLGGKYLALYVTSPKATTAHVQLAGGLTKSLTIQPYKTAAFNIPLAWEVRSAGKVEAMGIHVWSNDAEIECHVMSHNAYTSDGFTVIPSIGWGTEYVVAAFASLFEGGGTYVYDLPSQFVVVANQNGTRVTITPSEDLRIESSPSANCGAVFTTKGTPTTVTLDKGECIQCKVTCVQDCDNFDLTGSIVKSDKPVGLICGSECPNIPCDFPYCDHIVEMIPPTRTWAKTYYSMPFYQPPGAALSHSASTFLVIASKPKQKIYRFDAAAQQDSVLYCQLDRYNTFWRNDVAEGSKWFSDTAFLLVQYMNSASYPDNVNGQGDPLEMGVPAVENFQKEVMFQLPISIGNVTPYNNYVNVFANANDKHIMLDGVDIKAKATRVAIDGKFIGYRLSSLQVGGHRIVSDSGVGIQVYGYGYDESYGWIGQSAMATWNSPDTLAPFAFTQDNCFAATVTLVDSAKLNTGVYYVRVDSQVNMSYMDDVNYVEGVSSNALTYSTFVLDQSKAGYLRVSAFDLAGGHTTVVTTYAPSTAALSSRLMDFGIGDQKNCTYEYDTIVNTGTVADSIASVSFVKGNVGFTVDSVTLGILKPGERRLVKICFKPTSKANVTDTLVVNNACERSTTMVIGSGGNPDFYLTNVDFGAVLAGTKTPEHTALVHRTSLIGSLAIDSMYVEDPVHFIPTPTSAPNSYWITRHADSVSFSSSQQDLPVRFSFISSGNDTAGIYQTKWWAHSSSIADNLDNGWRSNTLVATIVRPTLTLCCDSSTVRCMGNGLDTVLIGFRLTATGTSPSTVLRIANTNPLTNLMVLRQNGAIVTRIDSMSEQLNPGSTLFIEDSFVVPLNVSAVYTDTVYALQQNPDGTTSLVSRVAAKVSVVDCSGDVKGNEITLSLKLVAFGHQIQIIGATEATPIHFELVDLLGKTRLSETAQSNAPIDISSLPVGVYLYRLTVGSKQVSGKIELP